MVTVSAPGKIHLMGEHAVVYGKPALLAALNLRLHVSIEDKKNSEEIEIISDEPSEYVRHIIDVVRHHLASEKLPGMRITIQSDIPSGYHLGSSAAVAVATIGALMYFLKKIWNPALINQLAYEAEKKAHGNPSGGDNTTVTMGGFIWFRKELEFLKSIWQLSFKISDNLNHFFLINTGRPKETTGEMVSFVKSQITNHKSQMEKFMNENELQTKRVAVAIKEENERELVDAIQKGERSLERMGVVSRKVIPLIREIEKEGGAAKILGGGGRKEGVGFILCYHKNPNNIVRLCKPYGYSIQPIQLGEEGVRLETHS